MSAKIIYFFYLLKTKRAAVLPPLKIIRQDIVLLLQGIIPDVHQLE